MIKILTCLLFTAMTIYANAQPPCKEDLKYLKEAFHKEKDNLHHWYDSQKDMLQNDYHKTKDKLKKEWEYNKKAVDSEQQKDKMESTFEGDIKELEHHYEKIKNELEFEFESRKNDLTFTFEEDKRRLERDCEGKEYGGGKDWKDKDRDKNKDWDDDDDDGKGKGKNKDWDDDDYDSGKGRGKNKDWDDDDDGGKRNDRDRNWEYEQDRGNGNGRQIERFEGTEIERGKDKSKNIPKGRTPSQGNSQDQSDYEYEIDSKDKEGRRNNHIEIIEEEDLQPYKSNDEIKVKGRTSSNQNETPYSEELESEILSWSNLTLPREVFEKMDKNTYRLYEKVQNESEATWYKAKGLEIKIMHPYAIKGSVVKIVNPENNNTVYARVAANTQNNDIKISSNAMELLGIYDDHFKADFIYFVEDKLGK